MSTRLLAVAAVLIALAPALSTARDPSCSGHAPLYRGLSRPLARFVETLTRWDGPCVTSAVRTREEQLALVRRGATRTVNSAHLSGRAVDLRVPAGLAPAVERLARGHRLKVLDEGSHLHVSVSGDSRRGATELVAIGVPAPLLHVFHSGPWPAARRDLVIDRRTLPVVVARVPAPGLPAVGDLAAALERLRPDVRALIRRIDLNRAPNPDDKAHWEKLYRRPFRSWMAAGADGVVHVFPAPSGKRPPVADLVRALSHEAGHILSGRRWGASLGDPRWAPWRAAVASDPGRVPGSDYSIGEDFADSFALYCEVLGTPREKESWRRMPARWRLLDRLGA